MPNVVGHVQAGGQLFDALHGATELVELFFDKARHRRRAVHTWPETKRPYLLGSLHQHLFIELPSVRLALLLYVNSQLGQVPFSMKRWISSHMSDSPLGAVA